MKAGFAALGVVLFVAAATLSPRSPGPRAPLPVRVALDAVALVFLALAVL